MRPKKHCPTCAQPLPPVRQLKPGTIVRIKATRVLCVVPHPMVLQEWARDKGDSVAVIVLTSGSISWRLPDELEIVHGFFRVQEATEAY